MIVREAYEPPLPEVGLRRMVALSGGLHAGSTHALGALDETVEAQPGAHLLVDLSQTTFLDPASLAAVVVARDRVLAEGGALSLLGASNHAQLLLQLWRLEPWGHG